MPNFTKQATELMKELGIRPNIKGYKYIMYAIELSETNRDITDRMITLYVTIAEKFNDNYRRVERAIRHAVESAWNIGNTEVQDELFRYTINPDKGKPTNSEFIATIVEHLYIQQEVE